MTPSTIGRYEIKKELGIGGMATVYLAYDPRFKREVALKVLPREFLHDPQFRTRFEREAETIAALEHSAIVPVYDFGEDTEAGQPYIVMRLMSGGSLHDRLERGPLALADAARIFSHLAPALDRAHSKNIIHRDLKPGNILFDDDGNPYISDFGIAKITTTNYTSSGTIVGTPAYMSPEQARGERSLDHRTDIYALGVIVFQALTGQLPFEADTPMGVAVKHVTDPVPSILNLKPGLPAECEAMIQRAMSKQPDDRFASASELARTLQHISAGTPVPDSARPTPRIQAAPTLPQRPAVTPPPAPREPSSRPAQPPSRFPTKILFGIIGLVGVVLIVSLILIGLLIGPQLFASLPFVSSNNRLAFASNRDGNFEIYLMNADGSSVINLTNNPASDRDPAWSPDGSKIAFHSNRDGTFDIYVINADGSGLTRIVDSPADDSTPDWSPDGKSIVFSSNRDGDDTEIYIMNVDGSNVIRLTDNALDDNSPDWSPDGQKIAFERIIGDGEEIFVMNLDGTNETQLTVDGVGNSGPDWSLDGKRILYYAFRAQANADIYVMNADGSNTVRLTSGPLYEASPAWSADGRLIAYFSETIDDDVTRREVFIMNADGTDQRQITNNQFRDELPVWQP